MPLYPMLLCFLVDCFTYLDLPFLSPALFIPSLACELGGCAKPTGVHLDLAVFFLQYDATETRLASSQLLTTSTAAPSCCSLRRGLPAQEFPSAKR